MVPLKLQLKNFMSYGEGVPPLDFSGFRVACLSGSNGHGKSALLDGITWALWGEGRKAAGDRKPDEGLLRLGATEMSVAFEFDLEGDRYRVIRVYRKSERGGIPNLEFQVYDPSIGGYMPLSESSSVTKTQEKINDVLRMDYQTFINSAFILQGRADEFTRKSARERKEVLADILGLARYDDLAKLARSHFQESDRACVGLTARQKEMDKEIAHKEEYGQRITELTQVLDALSERIRAEEASLSELRERRTVLQGKKRQIEELTHRAAQVKGDLPVLRQQVEGQRKQVEGYSRTVDQREEILAAFGRFEEAERLDGEYAEQLERLRGLEREQGEVEQRIQADRHKVEQRKGAHEAQLTQAQAALKETEGLLSRAEEIEREYAILQKAKAADEHIEEQRERLTELEERRNGLQKRIDEERGEIEVRRRTLEGQLRDLQAKAKLELEHKREAERAEAELKRLRELEREQSEIREKGTTLRVKIDGAQGQIGRLQQEIAQTEEKLAMLGGRPEATCPLCRSELDAAKRRNIEQEYTASIAGQKQEAERQKQEIQADDRVRTGLRKRYREIEEALKGLSEKQEALARARTAYGDTIRAQAEIQKVKREIEEVAKQLSDRAFAEADHRALAQVDLEIQAVGYDGERHQAVKKAIRERTRFEAEWAGLNAARDRHEHLRASLRDLQEKIAAEAEVLEKKRYAQKERARRQEILREIEAIGYDEAAHRKVREDLRVLRNARVQREGLRQAEDQIEEARRVLERLEETLEQRLQAEVQLEMERARLSQEVEGLERVEEEIVGLEERVRVAQREREERLGQRGGFQTRYDHCVHLEEERQHIAEDLAQAQKDRTVYEKLTVAFGKDGIQALIIEGAIPEIEQEANAILARLTDHRTQVTIEPLRDLKKGGTKETLDIKISDEMGTRSYELFSGGEAFRTDFAVRIALSKLLAKRAGTRLRTLVVDEGFGTQDAQGLEHLVEAIQAISEDFDKILVVTHLEQLKNAFPVRIEVVKRPDTGSTYEVRM